MEGSSKQLEQLLNSALQAGLREHYERLLTKKNFRTDDLAAGREYVEAYVQFVHYVELSTKLRHCRLKVISTSPERPPKKEIDAEHPPRLPDGAGGRHKLDLSKPRGDDSLVKEAVN